MNPALLLMGVYILVTFVLQALFFGVSELVDHLAPDWSLLVFLILFLCAYGFAWPIAVRLTEPKIENDTIQKDLVAMQKAGTILSFAIERRKDGPFVQVTRPVEGTVNVRDLLIRTIGHAVPEARISVGV